MVRILITLALSLTVSASAWAGNWNSSENSNVTSFSSIKLDCEMTNYRNTGYSVEWGQSWIPQKHTATISQGVIKSLTTGATGRVTRDTNKKIEFIFDEAMDERNDQGRVKGIYFKTNGKLMTRIHFGSGYIDSGPIWGKCVEMDFLPNTQSKQNNDENILQAMDTKGWIKVGSRNSIGIFVDANSKQIITKGSWKWYDTVHSELSENPSRETRFGWIWSSSDKLEPDNYEFKNMSEPESIKAIEFDGVKSFVIKSSLFDELIDAPQKYLYIYLKDYDDGSWFSTYAITSSCHKKPCVVIPNSTTPTTPTSSSNLDKAKSSCAELGFTLGTEKHGECVLKMMDN